MQRNNLNGKHLGSRLLGNGTHSGACSLRPFSLASFVAIVARCFQTFAAARPRSHWRTQLVTTAIAIALVSAPLSVHAQFPAEFELSSLNGTNGFVINSAFPINRLFRSIGSAGDVNDDGIDDLIIGVSGADPNGSGSGASYVVFGRTGGFSAELELSSLDGTNGFVLNGGDAGDSSGSSVSGAGDVNGDGVDDLLIGAAGAGSSGKSYVVYGQTGGFGAALELSNIDGTNGFAINGISSGRGVDPSEFEYSAIGLSVSGAGDINGDGIDDLLLGAPRADRFGRNPGESYVVFGQAGRFGPSLELSSLDGTNGFVLRGIDDGDFSGWSLSGAGDVNGDGFDDVLIGAPGADTNGRRSGKSYVVFGQAAGFDATLELSSLDGSNGFVLHGGVNERSSGSRVSGAGDFNGDGFDDLLIGLGAETLLRSSSVVFGKADGFDAMLDLDSLDGINGVALNSVYLTGRAVSSAGDVNGDGIDDVLIGAFGADPNGRSSGASYLVYGQTGGFGPSVDLDNLDGTNGFALNGVDAGDLSGSSVSGAGDINGDGVDDLIIGARGDVPNGADTGASYMVVFGRRVPEPSGAALAVGGLLGWLTRRRRR